MLMMSEGGVSMSQDAAGRVARVPLFLIVGSPYHLEIKQRYCKLIDMCFRL